MNQNDTIKLEEGKAWSNVTDAALPPRGKPAFEQNADASLARAKAIYAQRGSEYADTWGHCQFLAMKAVAKQLGIKIDEKYFRALATAAFVDMKYQRLEGGYKDDSVMDGMAYAAFLAEEMRKLGVQS